MPGDRPQQEDLREREGFGRYQEGLPKVKGVKTKEGSEFPIEKTEDQ